MISGCVALRHFKRILSIPPKNIEVPWAHAKFVYKVPVACGLVQIGQTGHCFDDRAIKRMRNRTNEEIIFRDRGVKYSKKMMIVMRKIPPNSISID